MPGTSNTIAKGSCRVISLEEVDSMTEIEVKPAKVSGTTNIKIKKLMKEGHDYIKAKRLVIKANFINAKIGEEMPKSQNPVVKRDANKDVNMEIAQKSTRSDNISLKRKAEK